MRPSALPSPSRSSEPSMSTRGQIGLPLMLTVLMSPCLTSTERPHMNLETNPSAQPMMPSLAAASCRLEQPSFMLLSRSTQTPVLPSMAPCSMSMSKDDAVPDERLRKAIVSLAVSTVS